MAFLDNSGDIVLDAVLTDTGRHRMARGDFRITKFALGDDEIDYSLYNKNHPSGSAYYDLEILKTPVLESFTNNASMMKSKLLTIGRTDFLYMPQSKLMDGGSPTAKAAGEISLEVKATQLHGGFRSYVVTVDHDTDKLVRYNKADATSLVGTGIILGQGNAAVQNSDAFAANPNNIQVETGLDTTDISPKLGLAADLSDNQFIVEIDSRLGSIIAFSGEAPGTGNPTTLPVSYVDDDGIASYIISGADLIQPPIDTDTETEQNNEGPSQSRIRGPRGNRLRFTILPHTNLRDSNYFFTRLGGEFAGTAAGDLASQAATTAGQNGFSNADSQKYRFIDTFVRVIGMTTGYTIDIPVRYVKKKS